jgi:hypothetical protein
MARGRSRGTTAKARASAAGAEPIEVTIEQDRTRYRATFRGAFAGALLEMVTATVGVWRELEWCGTWAWAGGAIGHRIDGKRTVRREALAAIALKLRAELVRRGAVDQADAKTPTRAKPAGLSAAEQEDLERARTEEGDHVLAFLDGDGHKARRSAAIACPKGEAVQEDILDALAGNDPDERGHVVGLLWDLARAGKVATFGREGYRVVARRATVASLIASKPTAGNVAGVADAGPMTWSDVLFLGRRIGITPHEGAQSPANVWACVQRLRTLSVARHATRDELHREHAHSGTETVDLAIAYLVGREELKIVTGGVTRRGNDVLARVAPEAPADATAPAKRAKLPRPRRLDPVLVSCPECKAEPGRKCRNYKGAGCAPHRLRVAAAQEEHARAERHELNRLAGELVNVKREADELLKTRCPDCTAPLSDDGSCDRCGWADVDGDHAPSPRTPEAIQLALFNRERIRREAGNREAARDELGAEPPANVDNLEREAERLGRARRRRLGKAPPVAAPVKPSPVEPSPARAEASANPPAEAAATPPASDKPGSAPASAPPAAPKAPPPPPSSPSNGSGKAGKLKPTREQFNAYRGAFRHFNKELFEGQLPEVILNFSRHAKSLGFFSPNRWVAMDDATTTHEITLNPDHLLDRTARETASTLVHELCHLWRHLNGKPPRKGYHDRQWAQRMKDLGLHPSSTGQPGGAEVGEKMTHYIVDGGPFDQAFAKLPDAHLLPWRSSAFAHNGKPCPTNGGDGDSDKSDPPPPKKQDPSKCKYTCPGCGANVWGKGGLLLDCRACEVSFVEV